MPWIMISRRFGRKIVEQSQEGKYCLFTAELDGLIFFISISRPSPKKENKTTNKIKTTGSTSFQDFEASVNDAWSLDDDEFGIIPGFESMLL